MIMRQARAEQMTLPLVGDVKKECNRIKREQFPFVMETTKWANRTTVCRLEPGNRQLFQRPQKTCERETTAIHKLTTRLVGKASIIALETLNVAGMLKNHKLARAIADAAFSEMVRQLRYKAVQVVQIDAFYPSSKTYTRVGPSTVT